MRRSFEHSFKITQQGATLNLSTIKSKMAFWSDGSVVGTQLTDVSGNNKHGYISDNIVTDGDAELGSVLTQWSSGTVENSTEQAHAGTRSFKFSIANAVTTAGMRYLYFRTKAGETVNYSFWIYRTVNTSLNYVITKGDGSNLYTYSQNPTLNTWVNITGSFVDAVGGGKGSISVYMSSGAMTYYIDDIVVTITGKTNLGYRLADDATLKTLDNNNLFYTAAGIPITLRSDVGDPTVRNHRAFCGGSTKIILTTDIPDVLTRYLLNRDFVDHNWIFDSCEVVKTVGAGKDYATIQAAIDATATAGLRNITNRYRFDLYDNVAATLYAHYAKTVNTTFKNIFADDINGYVYLSGIGDISISGTLPDDCTDAQMGASTLGDWVRSGGARNIKFKKWNGRYGLHLNASSLTDHHLIFLGCEFHHYGYDSVRAYRTANALPAVDGQSTGSFTPIGCGMDPGQTMNFINCIASGLWPITDHGGHTTGSNSYLFMYNCAFTSMPIYNSYYNPLSVVNESVRLTSTPGTNTIKSIAMLMKNTLNNPYSSTVDWTVTTK